VTAVGERKVVAGISKSALEREREGRSSRAAIGGV
jgi:hypothetical protein